MADLPPNPAGFPRELLAQPAAARYHYFATKVVAHHHLQEVHAALWQAIQQPGEAALILVFGPTGVGKTTLRQRIEQQLIAAAQADPTWDPGHIPVVSLDAVAPDSGNFSWKDYYTRALQALDEPLLTAKVGERLGSLRREANGRLIINRNVPVPDLRRVLEQGLLYRRPRAVLIDEAQHFQKIAGGRRLLDQMDSLKSLASMTQTLHVLIGTYDLLRLSNLSAQLSRRSREIHFPRYHLDRAPEQAAFQKLLRTLQKHLPLPEEPDLEGQADYFYERCLGCTGLLKTWLNRALAASLEGEHATLTPAAIEQQAEVPRRLLPMLQTIDEGERALREEAGQRAELRTLLGLAPLPASPLPPALPSPASPPAPRPPAARRISERKPQRDPVGDAPSS